MICVSGVRDYCQFEDFDAHCDQDEVVLMKAARYGRMRVGRCVSRDYGFIGCVANVMGELDRKCSGQRRCHFAIAVLREIYQPCPKDLTAYLEASYTCVKGIYHPRNLMSLQLCVNYTRPWQFKFQSNRST